MRAVLDTNVWLPAIFWEGEARKVIKAGSEKKIIFIVSEDIISEIVEVINREEKFQKFIQDKKQRAEDLTRTVLSGSTLIKIKSKIDLIKEHPQDNIILEAALDGKADYIVSYDNHILNMIEFRGKRILTPGEFLKMVG